MSKTIKVKRWAETHNVGVDEVVNTLDKLGVKNANKSSTIPSRILPLLEVEFGSAILSSKDDGTPVQVAAVLDQIQAKAEHVIEEHAEEEHVDQTEQEEKDPFKSLLKEEDPFRHLLDEIEPLLNASQKARLGILIQVLSSAAMAPMIDESQNQILTKSVPAATGTMSLDEVESFVEENEQVAVPVEPQPEQPSLFVLLLAAILRRRRMAMYGC